MDRVDILCLGQIDNNDIASLKLNQCWSVNNLSLDKTKLDDKPPKAPTLIVFIAKNTSTLSLSEILSQKFFLSIQNYTVKLCVFFYKPTSINDDLITYFNDFIFMPCAAEEFQSRISLLTCHLSHHKQPDTIALKEFAEFNLKGNSTTFTKTLHLIKKIATCDASVLIEGETGTGKENAARAVHYLSSRQDKAFIPINCGAIPDNLLESELFGFERGAFTDAKQRQDGMIAIANNGTLFLDEVDSLSTKAQAALLRFLQTGEYRPLGSNKIQQSNVRIIAATNANLNHLIEEKRFREDLYFRLNVLQVQMPPLRERPEDIAVIAQHLLNKYRRQYGNGPTNIHPATLQWLQQQYWKGNVRELENILLREFLLTTNPYLMIGNNDSNESSDNPNNQPSSFQAAKEAAIYQFERNYLETVLTMTEGNVSQAATLAGKERRALGKLIKKYDINPRLFKEKITEAYSR